ncbi:zinc finger protein ZAT9-like [Salvia divinorum]|uniref:Zinc finger protein ZAT9-like n=1 Tax=Salvia divinorum TaxID=28513 RepID=A0ABD1GC32_SALDI
MEVDQKSKHKCKFCRKMFPCGRSLGGHMRSHLINISSTAKKLPPLTTKRFSNKDDDDDREEVALSLILLSMDYRESRRKKRFKTNQNLDLDQSEVDSLSQSECCKFRCMICNKGFPSYQALGGHRASHKKFKGCCAPTIPTVIPKPDHHECPICFKVFPSGQALGGHKRSHLMITDHQPKNNAPRDFLDLNLPAPAEDELKPWWIRATREPLLSTS